MTEISTVTLKTEQLPIAFALPMALYEQKGLRKLIDDEAGKFDKSFRNLTAGMAVKAMVGIIFGCYGYSSLWRVKDIMNNCPTDKIFGPFVAPRTLSDTSIGKRFDCISKLDLGELSWKCHELIHGETEYDYFIIFLDGSNYTVYGMGYEDGYRQGGTVPRYGGNAKDGHNERLQKNLVAMTDQYGKLMCSMPFDGNTSDVKMDKAAIEFLKSRLDNDRTTIVADSKLATETILPGLFESGLGFVTKIPLKFDNKIHDDIVTSAMVGTMDTSNKYPGIEVYNTGSPLVTKTGDNSYPMRYVAFRFPGDVQEARDYLRGRGLKEMKKKATSFKRRRFHCEKDAQKAFVDMMASNECFAYDAKLSLDIDNKLRKQDPESACVFGRVTEVCINEGRFEEAAQRYSIKVLGTNLPYSDTDHENPREGLTPFGVVELYLKQDRAEKNFRRMKTDMGLDVGRLHKTNRLDVKQLVCAICVMLMNEMDTRLTYAGRETWSEVRFRYGQAMAVYNREADLIQFSGKSTDLASEIMSILDILGINPKLIIGH